jgi:hypothetical protein
MQFKSYLLLALTALAIAALIIFRPWVKESPEDVRLRAWSAFSSYVLANKNHSADQAAALSRKLSDACKDKDMETECFARMDYIVELTKDWKSEDFVNILFDKKQAVLSTDFKLVNQDVPDEAFYQFERSRIFFTRDDNGNPKITGLNPGEVWSIKKDPDITNETKALEKLDEMVADKDQDALPDSYETCDDPSDTKCEGTSPNLRDTDADGWWDGLEEYVVN